MIYTTHVMKRTALLNFPFADTLLAQVCFLLVEQVFQEEIKIWKRKHWKMMMDVQSTSDTVRSLDLCHGDTWPLSGWSNNMKWYIRSY
jgi:hypothetical protein